MTTHKLSRLVSNECFNSFCTSGDFMPRVMVSIQIMKKKKKIAWFQYHSNCNLHGSFCILSVGWFCSLFVCWVSLNKHVPRPSLRAPQPRLVAQPVSDQKKSCKQAMKRVMLRMTPSLNYSVFYIKPGLACCHHEGIYSYGYGWCRLLLGCISFYDKASKNV